MLVEAVLVEGVLVERADGRGLRARAVERNVRIDVRFSSRALHAGNYGIDEIASAARYAELLREAIERDFPGSEIVVSAEEGPSVRAVVTGADDAVARGTERAVLDLAWVVKQCAPWSVPTGS